MSSRSVDSSPFPQHLSQPIKHFGQRWRLKWFSAPPDHLGVEVIVIGGVGAPARKALVGCSNFSHTLYPRPAWTRFNLLGINFRSIWESCEAGVNLNHHDGTAVQLMLSNVLWQGIKVACAYYCYVKKLTEQKKVFVWDLLDQEPSFSKACLSRNLLFAMQLVVESRPGILF